MPKVAKGKKNIGAKNTKLINPKKKIGKNKRTASSSKSKSCPVGKVCFGFELNVRHVSIVLLLIVVVFLIVLFYKHHQDSQKVESGSVLSNFQNLGSKLANNIKGNSVNNKNSNSNKSLDNLENNNVEKPNITINYHLTAESKPNLIQPEIINAPPINTSTYLINKDYERVINPLEPPERRNYHMQATGLERLVAPRGVPINVPTRGYTGGIMQVGVLHKEDVSDESKKIGQTAEPVILPLFGRPTYNGSNKWSYYTSTDKMNQVKLPISNKNKVCNSEYGCDELYDGDNVSVPAYNGDFKVSIYEFDKPRYIPYV